MLFKSVSRTSSSSSQADGLQKLKSSGDPEAKLDEAELYSVLFKSVSRSSAQADPDGLQKLPK